MGDFIKNERDKSRMTTFQDNNFITDQKTMMKFKINTNNNDKNIFEPTSPISSNMSRSKSEMDRDRISPLQFNSLDHPQNYHVGVPIIKEKS